MRRAQPWVLLAMAPVTALAADPGAADRPPRAEEVIEAGFLEFLAEEPGLDEELSEALMTGDLDREIERSAGRREVQGNAKNEG